MRSRTLATLTALTLTAVLVSGCSDDEPQPRDEPSSSGSATTSPATEGSSATPSAAQVVPAAGQQMTMESGISFRLTEGPDWGVIGNGTIGISGDAEVEGVAELVILDAGEYGAVTDDFDRIAESRLNSLPKSAYPTLRRVEDRVVNGVTGFVLRSENDQSNFYLFGVLHEGTTFTISLEVPLELELEEWVEPILASIEWS